MMRAQLGQQSVVKTDYCVSMIQSLLVNNGRLNIADRTGYMNQATADALTYNYGLDWDKFPGGLCALATAGGIFGAPARPYQMYPGYVPPANPTTTGLYLLVGGAALVAILLMNKDGK